MHFPFISRHFVSYVCLFTLIFSSFFMWHSFSEISRHFSFCIHFLSCAFHFVLIVRSFRLILHSLISFHFLWFPLVSLSCYICLLQFTFHLHSFPHISSHYFLIFLSFYIHFTSIFLMSFSFCIHFRFFGQTGEGMRCFRFVPFFYPQVFGYCLLIRFYSFSLVCLSENEIVP